MLAEHVRLHQQTLEQARQQQMAEQVQQASLLAKATNQQEGASGQGPGSSNGG
jgi:hypothetical protein